MKINWKISIRIAALIAGALVATGLSLNAAVAGDAVAGYILELSSGANAREIAARYGLTVQRSWAADSHLSYAVSAPQPLASSILAHLKNESGVIAVEVNGELHTSEADASSRAMATPEVLGSWFWKRDRADFFGTLVQAGYVQQPGAVIVRADEAQRLFGKGSGVVAIIDTGVDPNHAALRDVLVPGYDFTRDRSDTVSELLDLDPATAAALQQSTVEILDAGRPSVQLNSTTVAMLSQSTVEILDGKGLPSAFGHGTMVAGLVHRVAPGARIMPLKAFRADGSAALSDIVRAILYAVDHGATTISMSFSFATRSAQLQLAIEYAASHGVLCVASAGNNGHETAVYPAAFKQVVGVGSTNFADRRSAFSNWGSAARTSAPGEALVTTFPGNTYAGVWGTSFSTALVSGATALFRQVTPGLRFESLKNALDYGMHIEQDMGDARLDLVRTIIYLQKQ